MNNKVAVALEILEIWYKEIEDIYRRSNICHFEETKTLYKRHALKMKTEGLISHDRCLNNQSLFSRRRNLDI